MSSRFKFSDGRKAKVPRLQLRAQRVKGAEKLPLDQRNVMVPVMVTKKVKGKNKKVAALSSRYLDYQRSTTRTRRNGGETVMCGGRKAKGRTR